MNKRVILAWAACAALSSAAVAARGNVEPLADRPVVLRTQQFESGEQKLNETPSDRLEDFLRDLNRRRDFDYAQHDGRPGPDHAYLTDWIHRVTQELIGRGYYFDPQGELHRPGTVVPTR